MISLCLWRDHEYGRAGERPGRGPDLLPRCCRAAGLSLDVGERAQWQDTALYKTSVTTAESWLGSLSLHFQQGSANEKKHAHARRTIMVRRFLGGSASSVPGKAQLFRC